MFGSESESAEDDCDSSHNSEETEFVQIHASKAELFQRIECFCQCKRMEVDESNIREFCFGLPDSELSNSCARVDAIFVKQAGSRSHITVQRVMNTHGPQTAVASQWSRIRLSEDNDDNTSLFSIDERIANAEKHLSLQADTRHSLFSRLHAVEQRILNLEGISPEYFHNGVPVVKKRERKENMFPPSRSKQMELKSITDIDRKAYALREKLKAKKHQLME